MGPVLKHLRSAAAAYVVLLLGIFLTLLATYYVHRTVEASARVQFDESVSVAQGAVERRVSSYVDLLLSVRGLFYASQSVEREEWRGYVESMNLERRYPGIQAMGYVEKVEPEEKGGFEENLARSIGDEGSVPSVRPAGERDAYYPVTFVEPFDRANDDLPGYDEYTNPTHRTAMDRARDTGEPVATDNVYVFSEAPSGTKADLILEPGLAVYLPVYKQDEPQETVVDRQRALDGFVVSYLTAEGLLRGVLEEPDAPPIDFEVYDGEYLSPNNLLHDDDGVWRAGENGETSGSLVGTLGRALAEAPGLLFGGDASRLNRTEEIEIAGREWTVYFEALPGATSGGESRLPLFVLLSGLGVSLLLFGTTYVLVRNRLRAERASLELEDANRELEVTNRELEAFSYSVSHDLRAPLRSIDGFSQILLEDYADDLDDDGKDYLGRVRAGSQRMGRLIDDLLGLSRVTRGALRRERVDLSALAREVAANLQESRPERSVEFEIEDGLEAMSDPRLVRVALTNLIGNAFKFTEKQAEARVEFGEDPRLSARGRVPVYRVRDNGAGFDMEYADKLFGAFQRLHGTDEFEGTGIGLATVQRIIHRHGGRIWAEGEVGKGATFYFTLRPGLLLDPSPQKREEREEVQAK